jgi:hypothetical protein
MAREDDAADLVARHATEAPAPGSTPAAESAALGSGRGAMRVTAGILFSRVFGLVRQRHYFGISAFARALLGELREARPWILLSADHIP